MAPKPTATSWVTCDQHGRYISVPVKEMTNNHLWRWVRYFRRKWRDGGFTGSDVQLDAQIQRAIVTAPAIYAEAKKRGVMSFSEPLTVQSLSPSAALSEFVNEIKHRLPTVYSRIRQVRYAELSVTVVLRRASSLGLVERKRPLLAALASQTWAREMVIVVEAPELVTNATALSVPKHKKRSSKAGNVSTGSEPATMCVEHAAGVRRITLDEEE